MVKAHFPSVLRKGGNPGKGSEEKFTGGLEFFATLQMGSTFFTNKELAHFVSLTPKFYPPVLVKKSLFGAIIGGPPQNFPIRLAPLFITGEVYLPQGVYKHHFRRQLVGRQDSWA